MKTKDKNKTEWYKLEVTAEQLRIIQECVEAVSRAKIGQWGDIIELILEDFKVTDYEFKSSLDRIINSKIAERLEGIIGIKDKDSYQLYRDILHYWAKQNEDKNSWNVYLHDYEVSKKPRIKIEKIENEKSE
jgi:hypothetical protein